MEIDWIKVESNYREHLHRKYTSYMTSANEWELNMLAALVDGRYKNNEEKYSTRTREECFRDIIREIKNAAE